MKHPLSSVRPQSAEHKRTLQTVGQVMEAMKIMLDEHAARIAVLEEQVASLRALIDIPVQTDPATKAKRYHA